MTIKELSTSLSFPMICGEGEKDCESVYCGDLLSVVMGKAPENSVWITVMGNINSIAVALLTDVACIIIADNMELDEAANAKAKQQNITVLLSKQDIFTTAKAVDICINQNK